MLYSKSNLKPLWNPYGARQNDSSTEPLMEILKKLLDRGTWGSPAPRRLARTQRLTHDDEDLRSTGLKAAESAHDLVDLAKAKQ